MAALAVRGPGPTSLGAKTGRPGDWDVETRERGVEENLNVSQRDPVGALSLEMGACR